MVSAGLWRMETLTAATRWRRRIAPMSRTKASKFRGGMKNSSST